jgi:1-acyl-sn-glycerol-3-phosphate acyltransferase
VPSTGPALLVANHASYLDPVLVGAAVPRRLSYLARSSLFRPRAFGVLIRAFGAIPLEREGVGIGGMRAVLAALAEGRVVLLFPEGTRSADGALGVLRTGAMRIAQRAGVTVVPVWIEGSGRALPRGAKLPRPRRIEVRFGAPYRVHPDADVGSATRELENRLRSLAVRRRTEGTDRGSPDRPMAGPAVEAMVASRVPSTAGPASAARRRVQADDDT